MADLRDYTKKNIIFAGTDGIRLPTGNNAQRTATSNVAGTMRYNSDIGGLEVYSPNGWTPLAAPPTITTVTPSTFNGESGTQFVVNGTNFTSDALVYFVTAQNIALLAGSVTYISSAEIRATTPRAIKIEEEPISVRVTQQSGTTTKVDCVDAGGLPTWVTTAGTLGSIFGANTVNVYVTATDPEGTAVSYQLSTGSLPGGISLSSNGLIQGVATAVTANTTYNFVIKANDTVNNNTDRSFSYTVLNRAPLINTAAGSLGTIYSGNAVPSTTISAYDPDGGTITFSAPTGNIVNTTIGSANGTIVGTPIVVTTNTTYTIGVTVTDQGSLTASNNYTFTVLNRPPVWNTAAELPSYSVESFTPITVNAYDPDGGSITYSLVSGSVPSGLTFVSANATITGSASDVDSNTTSTFTISATDIGNDSNNRQFSLTITPVTDSYFANTVLLVKSINSNTVIKDASSNNLPITVFGDARASNFSPYNTSRSVYFDGSSYMTIGSSADFAYGTGDFSMECRIFTSNTSSQRLVTHSEDSFNLDFNSSGVIQYFVAGVGALTTAAPYLLESFKWYHVVVTRVSGVLRILIDGKLAYYNSSMTASKGTGGVGIGNINGSGLYTGYMRDVRIVKGGIPSAYVTNATTLGTQAFTLSSNPISLSDSLTGGIVSLLACNNIYNTDANTTPKSITFTNTPLIRGFSPFVETDTTTGSMYFDGTGDYVGLGSPYNFGTNNFTVEGWFYLNSLGNQAIWGSSNGGGITSKLQLYISSGTFGVDLNGSTVLSFTASSYMRPGGWNHIALCRGGTSTNQTGIFVNGTRAALGTIGNQTGITTNFTIGYNESGAIGASYISNFRIVDGTDVYGYTNTTITVPSTPLSNIANTKLLTLQNRQPHNNHGFQDTSNNKLLVTRFGNTTQGSFTPFSSEQGKWSVFFDGSSDYLRANSTPMVGGGDLTIEAFVYPFTSSVIGVFDGGAGATTIIRNYPANYLGHQSGQQVAFSCTANRWNHLAFTANSTHMSVFVNGTLSGTTGIPSYGVGNFDIGTINTGTDGSFNGYISNFRVSNTRVYTANFTPPTGPLPITANTVMLTCASNKFEDLANYKTFTRNNDPKVFALSPFTANNAYSKSLNGGSMLNLASGDGLKFTESNLLFGVPGDYTVSLWYYPTGTTTEYNPLWIFSDNLSTDNPMAGLFFNSGYSLFWLNDGAGGNGFNANMGITIVPFQWNHIVVTRTAGTTRCWTNGKIRVDGWSAGSMNSSKRHLCVATNRATADGVPGYITGFEFINGTSLYTTGTNFTPPSSPPVPVANTVVLLNFTDSSILDYSNKNNIQTVADSKSNNSISKFNGSSIWSDSSGDYLRMNPLPIQTLPGAFTLEAWIYPISSGQFRLWGNWNSNTNGYALFLSPSGSYARMYYGNYGSNEGYLTSTMTIPLNTWSHFAVCRDTSSNWYFFLNGTSYGASAGGSTWTNSRSFYNISDPLFVGESGYNGAISDLRLTTGLARYTANFTPPTRSFPNR